MKGHRSLKLRKSKFLTGKQRAVFDSVRQRIYEGLPPTMRELAEHFGISAKAINACLWAIRKKGYLHWEYHKPRTLSLPPPYKDDTRYSVIVQADIPQLGIQKGDFLLIDTGKPAVEGDVILSTRGEIKRFATGDVAFGKVVGFSRTIGELA